jgi:SAM-dependent methyltransferase
VSVVPSDAERSTSFGSIAADYDRLRPQASAEAVDWLLPERHDLVVDVGAGTGLFSRALASAGAHVVAVEPDERMRAVLQERSAGVEVLAGTGEALPLPDASADGVFASSAWHWMDSDQAIPEVARVLRDGGRFGVIWTGLDRQTEWLRAADWFRDAAPDSDPFTGTTAVPHGPASGELPVPAGEFFTNIETAVFRFSRPMAPTDLVELLTTYSRVITAPADMRERGRERAAAAITGLFPGASQIDVPFRSRCWRADRTPRNMS